MIVGVKGLDAPAYRNNISVMVKKLRTLGLPAKELLYRKLSVFETYDDSRIDEVTYKLYKSLKDGDSIVAHSFGGHIVINLLNNMHKYGRPKKLKNVYLFNPADDQDRRINSRYFKNLYLFFDPEDQLLRFAMWLPFNRMGSLGKFGYKYKSKKIHNIKIYPGKFGKYNHHKFAAEPYLTKYANFIKMREERK